MTEIVLTGLDGSNPLAFFAALGVLRVLDETAWGEPRLRWEDRGRWRPVLTADVDREGLVERVLRDRDTWAADPALGLEYDGTRDLKPPPAVFRALLEAEAARAHPHGRRTVDMLAAFATDVATDNNGNTKPTALHFTAGQQKFLEMVTQLREGVQRADVEEALFGPWRYTRPLPVLGWDGTASRDYALRASDPAKEKKLGVPGADWLALRALPFFPCVPDGDAVRTTGCAGGWKTGRFTWPLWTVALSADVVASLLSDPRLPQQELATRAARGVGAVLSCNIKRSDQGGYGSFTPARHVVPAGG
jgi:hypothetical protein